MSTIDVAAFIDEKETTDLLRQLIRTKSVNPPGQELAIAQTVAAKLEEFGLEVTVQPITEDRANVIGILRGQGKDKSLMLSGHLDTVPVDEAAWEHDPFGADIVGNRMYGVGASDMKGGVASMMAAAAALARMKTRLKGDVILGLTAGEEVNYLGARELLKAGYLKNVKAIVIGEPSDLKLITATRGVLWLKINTVGRPAHGSMPSEGVNAIMHMYAVLKRLLQDNFLEGSHSLLGEPTMAVTTINGGVKTNVIPHCCSMTLDIRTVPPQDNDQVIKRVRELLKSLGAEFPDFDAELQVLLNHSAVSTHPEQALVKEAQSTAKELFGADVEPVGVCFASEGSLYVPETGIPMIIYGPGSENLAHQKNEYVKISNVVDAAKFYACLAQKVLG